MSENTHIATLDNHNSNAASHHDWTKHAPPEMTLESIEALRAVIGGIVWVKWYDPRTITHAPWVLDYPPQNMMPDVCYSVGMSDDLPDEMAILLRPHFVGDLFEDNEGRAQGEIVIPYRSIQMIRALVCGEDEFSCCSSGRPDACAAVGFWW